MNREMISPGQFFLVVLGLVAWVAAALFGILPTTVDAEVAAGAGTAHVKTPSLAGAGAACGFAVAGGLCFLAAARVTPPPPPGRVRTDFAAVLDQLRFNGILTDAEYRAMMDKVERRGAKPPGEHPRG